jgi:hypothetical protein
MRGDDKQQLDVFSYVSPEQRIPQAGIRTMSSPFDLICGIVPNGASM